MFYYIELMTRYIILFLSLLISVLCSAQSIRQENVRLTYEPPILWQPNTYVCQQAVDEISIDGVDIESSWRDAEWSDYFVDLEGVESEEPAPKSRLKMLWDKENLYLFVKLEETHIWATHLQRDTLVYQDDAFEVFIDPDGDAHNYYEFQVNAFNTLWDLFLLWPYRERRGSNYLTHWDASGIQHAVHIEGTLNNATDLDAYWTVEMAIPWIAVQEMAPKRKAPQHNDQWRINFARVDWSMKIINGSYEKSLLDNGQPVSEDYSVWSPHGTYAMHMPEWWGYVQFSDSKVDELAPKFKVKPDEEIKWALWQLYYQQKEFYEKTGRYAKSIEQFTVPSIEACSFEPNISVVEYGFQLSAPACNGKGVWVINERGLIDYEL